MDIVLICGEKDVEGRSAYIKSEIPWATVHAMPQPKPGVELHIDRNLLPPLHAAVAFTAFRDTAFYKSWLMKAGVGPDIVVLPRPEEDALRVAFFGAGRDLTKNPFEENGVIRIGALAMDRNIWMVRHEGRPMQLVPTLTSTMFCMARSYMDGFFADQRRMNEAAKEGHTIKSTAIKQRISLLRSALHDPGQIVTVPKSGHYLRGDTCEFPQVVETLLPPTEFGNRNRFVMHQKSGRHLWRGRSVTIGKYESLFMCAFLDSASKLLPFTDTVAISAVWGNKKKCPAWTDHLLDKFRDTVRDQLGLKMPRRNGVLQIDHHCFEDRLPFAYRAHGWRSYTIGPAWT
jgi:hypothetical protein